MNDDELVEMWMTEKDLGAYTEMMNERLGREAVGRKPMGKIMSDEVALPMYCYYNEYGTFITVYAKQDREMNVLKVR